MFKFKSSIVIEIPFHDLDPMNVVWHGNYVKYLEQARCDMFKKLSYTYYDMKIDGVAYPIAKMDLKYIKPCIFGQKILVETLLQEIEPCMIIKYRIFDVETNEKIFVANSMQICVDINTGESVYVAPINLKKSLEQVGGNL